MPDTLYSRENGLPLHDDGTQYRVLGALPPDGKLRLPYFASAFSVIPESEWQECSLRSWNPPILDQGRTSSCFPAGTLIRMANGAQQPIEDVRLLDAVLTAEGNIGVVTQLMVRRENKGLYRIRTWGHSHLRMTEEHPVLTKRGYVEAKDLLPGDWIALPRYLAKTKLELDINDYLKRKRTCVEKKSQEYKIPGKRRVKLQISPLPEKIKLNHAFGKIIGYFLAEGSTAKSSVVWTFGIHEQKTHVAELVHYLKTELDVDAHVKPIVSKNTCKVSIYGVHWAELFEALCGNGSGKKKLHPDICAGPEEFLKAVFAGWLEGDGYYSKKRHFHVGVTVSHSLALSMFDIANAVGLRPSIRTIQPKLNKGVKTRKRRWDVNCASKADNYRIVMDEKYTWRRITSITREMFDGDVYNLEVGRNVDPMLPPDNSYVAEGVGVHNCVGHGSVTGFTFAWLLSGQTFYEFSPTFIYAWINGGQDKGAQVAHGLEALKRYGTCFMSQFGEDKIYSSQMTAEVRATAMRFRVLDAYKINSWEEMGTALIKGFTVVSGIAVGNNFSKLDSNGVVPLPDTVIGGHCLCQTGLKKASGVWTVETHNSWSKNWGQNGYCYLLKDHFSGRYGFPFDAYAIASVIDDPVNETEDPPILKEIIL